MTNNIPYEELDDGMLEYEVMINNSSKQVECQEVWNYLLIE